MDWWAAALSWEDHRVLRTLGVFLAVLGAVLVSPHGFKRLVYLTQQWIAGIYWAIRGRSIAVFAPVARATTGKLSARGVASTSIPPDASTEEKVRLLELDLNQLKSTVQNDYDELSGKISKLGGLVGNVDQRVEVLLARLQQERDQTVTLDAAGLPVIAWGIILSGVPQELAADPQIGWFFIVLGLILGFAMLRKTVRDGAWSKKGSEA